MWSDPERSYEQGDGDGRAVLGNENENELARAGSANNESITRKAGNKPATVKASWGSHLTGNGFNVNRDD